VVQDLKVDPDFPAVPVVWVLYAPNHQSVGKVGAMRVAKIQWLENAGGLTSRGGKLTSMWTDPQDYVGLYHYGGQLVFGPNKDVFFALGDKYDFPMISQDLTNTGGKIYRMRYDGTAPPDNFGVAQDPNKNINDHVYAYGIRNPFRAHYDLPTNRYLIAEVYVLFSL
jgi:glucose/arabinose dehydrogenase